MRTSKSKNAEAHTSFSPKKILILTLSGGGGHLQAASAKYQEMLVKYPNAHIVRRDILLDWLGPHFGGWISHLWNSAQATGSVSRLELFASLQGFFDKLVWPVIFIQALRTCLKEDIDYMIDTQNISTAAILKALRVIKLWKKKTIRLDKVITDLPTKDTTHFFAPIKKLSKKDRAFLHIITTTPLLSEGQSEAAFWKDACNISKDDVIYANLPVRPSFLRYKEENSNEKKPLPLQIEIPSKKDQEWLQKIASFGNFPLEFSPSGVSLTIQPTDKLAVIMLGATPHEESVLAYAKEFIDMVKKGHYQKRRDILFILATDLASQTPPLPEKILKHLKEVSDYPNSLTIIPLSRQPDTILAPLFYRSDATFTKSGGLTSMELLSVCHGKIWIHKGKLSETKPSSFLSKKSPQMAMPPWERGNARYLAAKKGAKFISPELFSTLSKDYFPVEKTPAVH